MTTPEVGRRQGMHRETRSTATPCEMSSVEGTQASMTGCNRSTKTVSVAGVHPERRI